MMKFKEAQLEQAFIVLLEKEGYPLILLAATDYPPVPFDGLKRALELVKSVQEL